MSSFQIGGNAPDGQPIYLMETLKDFQLHIPPSKKPKLEAEVKQPTTAAQSPTTNTVELSGPRKELPETQAPQRGGFMYPGIEFGRDSLTDVWVPNVTQSSAIRVPPSMVRPTRQSMSTPGSKSGQSPAILAATLMQVSKAPAKTDTSPKTSETPAPMVQDFNNSCIDPQSWFSGISGIDGGLVGVFADPTYRTLAPDDAPEFSQDSGSSEPNSEIIENANIDIDVNWQPFDDNLLMDLGNINMESFDSLGSDADLDAALLTGALSSSQTIRDIAWEEANIDHTKPFTFDGSLYSMDKTT
jgi:hypothetical protein